MTDYGKTKSGAPITDELVDECVAEVASGDFAKRGDLVARHREGPEHPWVTDAQRKSAKPSD